MRGQASLESILLWAGLLAVLGLFLPSFLHVLDAHHLQWDKGRFLSFSDAVGHSLVRLSHYAEGSMLSIPSPSLEELDIRGDGHTLTLTWSPPSLSSPLLIEQSSLLPLEGEWSPDSHFLVLRRESNFILIESG
ncbi:MAG: hypothetical protein AABW68_01170 [archaeon]